MFGTGLVTFGVCLGPSKLKVGQNFTFYTSAIWKHFTCLISGAFWDKQATLLKAPVRSLFLLKIKESFAEVAQSDLIF